MDPLQPSHRFHAHLFGAFTFWRGKQVVPLRSSANALALFGYLLLHREQPHPREVLVRLFSPDLSENRARRALKQALWHIGASCRASLKPTPTRQSGWTWKNLKGFQISSLSTLVQRNEAQSAI